MKLGYSATVVLLAVACLGVLPADTFAMYQAGLGAFMQRDPGDGGAMRIGTGGPASLAPFLPSDPGGQYRDGPNLYQYCRGNTANGRDPQGEAVVFFGGGMYFPGGIPSGPLFKSAGFLLASAMISSGVRGRPPEPSNVYPFNASPDEAASWLATLKPSDKCEVRIVGFSSGCSRALALAHKIQGNPQKYGKVKVLLFYDFNWGAASHPDYASILGGDLSKPNVDGLKVHHVVSSGLVLRLGYMTWMDTGKKGLFGEPIKLLLPGQPISDWTAELWRTIRFRQPTAGEYALHGLLLGNTSGMWTARETGQAWLAPTQTEWALDHYGMGLIHLALPGNILDKLYDN